MAAVITLGQTSQQAFAKQSFKTGFQYVTGKHALTISATGIKTSTTKIYYGKKLVKTANVSNGKIKATIPFKNFNTFYVYANGTKQSITSDQYATNDVDIVSGYQTSKGLHYLLGTRSPAFIHVWKNKQVISSKVSDASRTTIFIPNKYITKNSNLYVSQRVGNKKTSHLNKLPSIPEGQKLTTVK